MISSAEPDETRNLERVHRNTLSVLGGTRRKFERLTAVTLSRCYAKDASVPTRGRRPSKGSVIRSLVKVTIAKTHQNTTIS